MNYDELMKRLEGEEMIPKARDCMLGMLDGVHMAARDLDFEVYGKHNVCIFVRGPFDAIVIGAYRRIDMCLVYHPNGDWNVGSRHPEGGIVAYLGRLLTGKYIDDDLQWTVDQSGSPAGFYKTNDYDVYYGKTALRAAEAYAADCSIPLQQAFTELKPFGTYRLNGEKLVAPDAEGAYMGTAVLVDARADMALRTKPWEE